MGRLTKETIAQLKEFVCYHRTLCDDAICRKEEGCFVNWAIEGLQELQHYKDLEEQGRLVEQKHGKWIRTGAISYRCSECNFLPLQDDTAFCPNCGAKMELKELEGVKE